MPDRREEWWRRLDAERGRRSATGRRRVVERRWRRHDARWSTAAAARRSAAVAALASSGEPVLALCADALRRRELVERAAAPGALRRRRASRSPPARLADDAVAAADAPRWPRPERGVVLADWAALAREPAMAAALRARGARRPAAVRRTSSAGVRARRGGRRRVPAPGLGRGRGRARAARAREEWPRAPAARGALPGAATAVAATRRTRSRRAPLARRRRAIPRSPEVAGRCLRVLEELGRRRLGAVRHRARAPRRILGGDGSGATRRPSSPTATGMRRAGDS